VAGCRLVDQGVDLVAVADHRRDQFARQVGGHGIAFRLGQMALEDGLRGPLPEVRLEDRRQRESTSGASSALPVSLRRHRR